MTPHPPAQFPLPRTGRLLAQYHAECEAVVHGVKMAANNARWYADKAAEGAARRQAAMAARDSLAVTFADSVAHACAACAERQAVLAAEQLAEAREFAAQAAKMAAALTADEVGRLGGLSPFEAATRCNETALAASAAAAQAKSDAEKAAAAAGRTANNTDVCQEWAQAIEARREDP